MVESSATRIDQIESWFRKQDDGEFSVLPSEQPSTQTGDLTNARTIVYTTKRHCVPRIKGFSQFGEPITKPRANHMQSELALELSLPVGPQRMEQSRPTRDVGAEQET
jgi:hypothetical protein